MTPREIFASVEQKIFERPERTSGLNAVYKFVLTGQEGGTWVVDLREGSLGVRQNDEDAHCTLTLSDKNFVRIATGKLKAEYAFMTGKLKFFGDLGLAMKLGKILGK